jgi:hypothetical protein
MILSGLAYMADALRPQPLRLGREAEKGVDLAVEEPFDRLGVRARHPVDVFGQRGALSPRAAIRAIKFDARLRPSPGDSNLDRPVDMTWIKGRPVLDRADHALAQRRDLVADLSKTRDSSSKVAGTILLSKATPSSSDDNSITRLL